MKKVFIETTIPSFYYEIIKEPDMESRRDWTRDWWDKYAKLYELYSSEAVIEELETGNYSQRAEKLDLLTNICSSNLNCKT